MTTNEPRPFYDNFSADVEAVIERLADIIESDTIVGPIVDQLAAVRGIDMVRVNTHGPDIDADAYDKYLGVEEEVWRAIIRRLGSHMGLDDMFRA